MLRHAMRAIAIASVAVTPLLAVVSPGPATPRGTIDALRPQAADAAEQARLTRQSAAWQRFLADNGDRWSVRWDERTQAAVFVQGRGVQLLDASSRDLAALERAGRDFLGRHGALFGVRPTDLRFAAGSGFQGREGEMGYAHFVQTHAGLPVVQGHVYLRLKQGRLIQVEAMTFPGIAVTTTPGIGAEAATQAALADAASFASGVATGDVEARLVVFPEATGEGFAHHLAWRLGVTTEQPYGLWTVFVDAHDGAVLDRFNRVHHVSDGTVTGQVRPKLPVDPVITVPLESLNVTVGTDTVTTDASGFYSSPLTGTQTRTGTLTGPRLNVQNSGGAEAVVSATGTGTVDLEFTTSNARVDEMTTYHWAIQINNEAQEWLSLPWLNTSLRANVNLNQTCNAFYDGSINFFREGGGCANTGEFADVVAHEWGHGIDDNDGNGISDSGFSEGFSDVTGMVVSNDCLLAEGFFIGSGALRDNCVPCPKSQCTSFDPHITGQIYASAMWCVREELVAKLGETAGLDKWKELIFVPLPTISFLDGSYDAILAVDDDNGNLADGTPNLCEVNTCFADVEVAERLPDAAAPDALVEDIDDSAGNGNGFPESGETVVVTFNVGNSGCAGLTGVMATLSTTTPDVTIVDPTLDLGDIGGPGSAEATYTIEIGSGVPCGEVIDLTLDLTTGQGNFSFAEALAVGPVANDFWDAMEMDTGWTSVDQATTGGWERAVPQATFQDGVPAQPGQDHTGAGELAWVTEAAAGSGVGSFDVDGGPVRLMSPTFDLSGVPAATVSYSRWFYNGTVLNDSMVVEASNDGGASWTLLEEVTGVQNSYQQVDFDLGSFLPLTNQVQIRFTTSDSPNDSITEAVIDDFRIDAVDCSGTAAAVVGTTSCDPGPHPQGTTVPVAVSATNTTGSAQTVLATVDAVDSAGAEIPRLNRSLSLQPFQVRSGSIPIQTGFLAPGDYTVRLRLIDGTQILSETSCSLTVE